MSQLAPADFNDLALRLFRHQAANNEVYAAYIHHLGVKVEEVGGVSEIPFLPISFFKNHLVQTGQWTPETIYTSSGTTGAVTSRHAVWSEAFYVRHAEEIFRHFFGAIEQYHVLALLPSYLERAGSSLVVMAQHFVKQSGSSDSGFYLYNVDELMSRLIRLRANSKKVLLLGVTFALLDLAERFEEDLSHCVVMETGGMKGRRPEITRQELHDILQKRLHLASVTSEYGMTELMSQAYSKGSGVFEAPWSMKVLLRDPEDPLDVSETREQGAINIIDLANFHSCAFIETQDLGKMHPGGYFEVLGRMDNSDIRGCNLMVG